MGAFGGSKTRFSPKSGKKRVPENSAVPLTDHTAPLTSAIPRMRRAANLIVEPPMLGVLDAMWQ